MTTNFYAPPSNIRKKRVVLPEEEAHHARTVLRVQEGDTLPVVDGKGNWYQVRIDHLAPQQIVGTILQQTEDVGESGGEVTVALGLLKKRQRFETFVEKAVELGVTRIVPLQTARTEAKSIREERLQNIMIAALKQCRRSRLPTLASPQSVQELLDTSDAENTFLCHPHEEDVPLLEAMDPVAKTSSVLILVGPEGGFSSTEARDVLEAGGIPVSLGPRRLRAETAALTALSATTLARQRDGSGASI